MKNVNNFSKPTFSGLSRYPTTMAEGKAARWRGKKKSKINFNKQIDEATEEIEAQAEVSLFNLLN